MGNDIILEFKLRRGGRVYFNAMLIVAMQPFALTAPLEEPWQGLQIIISGGAGFLVEGTIEQAENAWSTAVRSYLA